MFGTRRRRIVAIVGAGGQVGLALRGRLAREQVEVRPLERGDDLQPAIKDAYAVVHLAGTLRPRRPQTYREANLGTVADVCAALEDSATRRILFLSFPGASAGSANPYLQYKAEAEQLLRDSGVPAVIVRCAHIYGPPEQPGPTAAAMLAGRRGVVWVLGPGTQRYAWVALEDVAEVLARAVLREVPAGTFGLAGPHAYPVNEFVRLVNPGGVRIRHLPARVARLAGHVLPGLAWPLVDVMLRDCLPDAATEDMARLLGVAQHPLAQMWPQP